MAVSLFGKNENLITNFRPLMTSKALQTQNNDSIDTVKLDNTIANATDTTSSLRICLREKKRGRQNGKESTANWRSSTTILDSVYKDLSKSIPAIDDVSLFLYIK